MRHAAQTIILTVVFTITTVVSPLAVFADSLSVSAVVPANATNFSAVLSGDTKDNVGQDKTLTYTLTYGSTLTTDTPVTLEVNWSRGTITGSGAQADVLSYVPGKRD